MRGWLATNTVLGLLCLAMGMFGMPTHPASGFFAVAGAVLLGASLIAAAIVQKKS